MKPCLKKTALAVGVSAALIGVSTVSQAQITGDAGEANLVPFAVWSSGASGTKSAIDTMVRVTTPSTVGNKTITNVYTANNATPNVAGGGAYPLPLGDQTPWETFKNPATNDYEYRDNIHWYFMNYQSIELINGEFPVSPEDVALFSLASEASGFENQPGYLVFTTAEGAAGHEANFAFFADAWLEVDNASATGISLAAPYTIHEVDIPVLPMSDGDDVTSPSLSIGNQVIEVGSPTGPNASPWFSGIPTGWMGASAGAVKSIDLTLGGRSESAESLPYYKDALLVVWSDQNFSGWAGSKVHYDTFDEYENGCSGSLSLPYELNLIWAPTLYSGASTGAKAAPSWVSSSYGGQTYNFCNPGISTGETGFVRLQLPLVSTTNFATAYAFSIPVWSDGNYLVPTKTFEANDRGAFSSTAGAWPGH
ncbi:MAG: hypothetical protein PHT19_11485 [Methylococcus sp.]|nr:hypothetical protein [Methylococcus sp.]